jgi:hypothetical protein
VRAIDHIVAHGRTEDQTHTLSTTDHVGCMGVRASDYQGIQRGNIPLYETSERVIIPQVHTYTRHFKGDIPAQDTNIRQGAGAYKSNGQHPEMPHNQHVLTHAITYTAIIIVFDMRADNEEHTTTTSVDMQRS